MHKGMGKLVSINGISYADHLLFPLSIFFYCIYDAVLLLLHIFKFHKTTILGQFEVVICYFIWHMANQF